MTGAWALDYSPASIDPTDIQQFEQGYEGWIQGLIQNIVPTQKPTVLVEVSYSQKPERLQTYNELKTLQHLPGLPDVLDPHVDRPSDSPISALVNSRKIKIIFEKTLTPAQEKLLAEVLNTKLHLNAAAGDQLVVSTIEAAPAQETNRLKDPKFMLTIVFGALILAALLSRRGNAKPVRAVQEIRADESSVPVVTAAPAEPRKATPPPPPVKPFQFNDQDRQIMNRLVQVNSALLSKTSSIVSPTQIILKSEPRAVIRVIRSESPATVAHAIHGTSILFQKTILSICTSRQRVAIRELAKKEKIAKSQTLFAQNLIAAKIHRELQTLSIRSADQFVAARESIRRETAALQDLRKKITAATQPINSTPSSDRESEVQL